MENDQWSVKHVQWNRIGELPLWAAKHVPLFHDARMLDRMYHKAKNTNLCIGGSLFPLSCEFNEVEPYIGTPYSLFTRKKVGKRVVTKSRSPMPSSSSGWAYFCPATAIWASAMLLGTWYLLLATEIVWRMGCTWRIEVQADFSNCAINALTLTKTVKRRAWRWEESADANETTA